MRKRLFFVLYLFLLLFSILKIQAQNYLYDGDFEYTIPWYTVDGAGYTEIIAPSGFSSPGQYGVINNPKNFNVDFLNSNDHTTGLGKMLVIDGNTTSGQQSFLNIFNSGNGTCALIVGETYIFSYWIKSVSTMCTGPATLADIGISIENASSLTLVQGATMAPLPMAEWKRVSYSFVATSKCVHINLWNNNHSSLGNDFAIDDIELTYPFSFTYSLAYDACRNSSTSFLTVYTRGSSPYKYSISGPVTEEKNNGQFNLPAGNYNLTITDANGISITKPVTISIPEPHLSAGDDEGICSGSSVTLTSSGDTNYKWSALPPDPSLTNNSGLSSVTVSPLQNTKYTVTGSSQTGTNLIFNGDFSLGNIGFDTRYVYRTTDSSNTTQSYGVVSNPSQWNAGFMPCNDHTTGNGMMLAANGAPYDETGMVWEQIVPIDGNTHYTFSFWVQSLSPSNFSRFQATVNSNATTVESTPTVAAICGNWTKFSFTFITPGIADIISVGIRNTQQSAIGNDFAIDDIVLTRNDECNTRNSITVYVNSIQSPEYNAVQPVCGNTGSITITTPAFQYSFDNGASWQTYPVKNNLAPGTYILLTKNNDACISMPQTVLLEAIPTLKAPLHSSAQVLCIESLPYSHITIEETAARYSFDGGLTWTTNNTLYNLIPGHIYKLMFKNLQGCISKITEVEVMQTIPSPAIPEVTVLQPSNCTQPTGSIKITSTAYNYSFNNGATWGTSKDSGPLSPGTYYVITENDMGCDSDPAIITINYPGTEPTAPQILVMQPTCSANTGTITINETASSYSFNNGTTWSQNPVSDQLLPGTYMVKTINNEGCESPATQAVINDSGKPSVPVVVTIQPDCNNTTGTITVINPMAIEFSFDNGATWSSQNYLEGLAEDNYNIKIKNIYGCISDALNITIAKTVVPLAISHDVSFCQNEVAQPLEANGSGLLWYNTFSATVGNTVSPVPDTGLPGTVIYYVSQTINGCESAKMPITVTIESTPLAPTVISPVIYCEEDIINRLSATGTKLMWYTQLSGGTGSTVAPLPSADSVYYVSQTSINGCESSRASIKVIINPAPAAPLVQSPVIYNHNDITFPLTASGSNLTWYDEELKRITKLPVTPKSNQIGQTKYYVSQRINDCESPLSEIVVDIVPNYIAIQFPKFFTPNGDNINETWNINVPKNNIKCRIYIFDKYGKLLTGITAPGRGWDGTFNGYSLPATDYWFQVIYNEYGAEKEFKSHFSLLR